MKIILLKDIAKVGKRYDVKDVSSGHAQNLLIPRGDAIAATPAAMKHVELEKAKADGERQVRDELHAKNLAQLDGVTVTFAGKANAKGHLFAGLHQKEIAAEVAKQARLEIDPAAIQLDQPLKEVGSHPITVKTGGKSATFTLVIEAK